MQKILSQKEIDSLLRAAQQGQVPKDSAQEDQRNVQKFDLRLRLEVNLVSVEQLNYSEGLSRLPDLACLSSMADRPQLPPAVRRVLESVSILPTARNSRHAECYIVPTGNVRLSLAQEFLQQVSNSSRGYKTPRRRPYHHPRSACGPVRR
jgi:hypothetical protein